MFLALTEVGLDVPCAAVETSKREQTTAVTPNVPLCAINPCGRFPSGCVNRNYVLHKTFGALVSRCDTELHQTEREREREMPIFGFLGQRLKNKCQVPAVPACSAQRHNVRRVVH